MVLCQEFKAKYREKIPTFSSFNKKFKKTPQFIVYLIIVNFSPV